jgi:GAF domain-containing protein
MCSTATFRCCSLTGSAVIHICAGRHRLPKRDYSSPFYVNGKAVGTIWAIAHNDRRKFDAEDLRLLESLGRFASAAYQAVASIDDLKFQIVEREKAETAVRELAIGLQAKIRCLVDSSIIGIVTGDLDGQIPPMPTKLFSASSDTAATISSPVDCAGGI